MGNAFNCGFDAYFEILSDCAVVFGHDVFSWDAVDYPLQARSKQALSSTGGPRALLLMAIGLVHLFEALEFWRA